MRQGSMRGRVSTERNSERGLVDLIRRLRFHPDDRWSRVGQRIVSEHLRGARVVSLSLVAALGLIVPAAPGEALSPDTSDLVPRFGVTTDRRVGGVRDTVSVNSCSDSDAVLTPATANLTSNRGDQLPYGRVQLAAFAEGSGPATLSIEFEATDGSETRYLIQLELDPQSEQITTAEYEVYGLAPTGRFGISGIRPEAAAEGISSGGAIHGVAFGGLWRDEAGYFRTIQSFDKSPAQTASFVGAWPLEISEERFEQMTPQLETSEGRDMARAMLFGAKVITNGCYRLRRAAQ